MTVEMVQRMAEANATLTTKEKHQLHEDLTMSFLRNHHVSSRKAKALPVHWVKAR